MRPRRALVAAAFAVIFFLVSAHATIQEQPQEPAEPSEESAPGIPPGDDGQSQPGDGEVEESTETPAQDRGEAAPATPRELLDSIRNDLVELRFEKALAALEPLITSPVLTDDERVEAMVLRSQTHAAFGDFESAEEGYRQILMRRPGWVPDRSLTPKKAMSRFEKARDELIGRVRFILDPADATLWIDGRERLDTLESIPLLAGSHTIRAARRGHDPVEQTVEVEPGENIDVPIELIPNARTVILRTEPEDVEVWLDGRLVGRTARVEEFLGLGQAPAQLVLEDVPLGEHTFEFRAECRRAAKIVDALNIDLLDRAPKRYDAVRLAESYVLLKPVGGPGGAEFRVDGRPVATLPTDVVQACPGGRELQVVYADRVLWAERRTLVEGAPQSIEIRARPNLALVGLDRLPRDLDALARAFNVVRLGADEGDDFSREPTWDALELDRTIDLALAPDADSRRGAAQSWWLYSPVLRTLDRLEGVPRVEKPSWRIATWGWTLVDAGGPLVVETFGSVTGRPPVGSRVRTAGGLPVADVATLREQLAAASGRGAIELEWTNPDGSEASGRLVATVGPWLREPGARSVDDAFRAAWAVVEADSLAPDAPAALANLALVFGARGEHALAARTWQRVEWPERDGIGPGTVDYYLGRELQALRRDDEAIEALRRAAASRARTGTDCGPPVAPAARDRLADLGQAP